MSEEQFVIHVEAWDEKGISYNIVDLVKLATRYGCEIPKEFKHRIEPFMLRIRSK